jgi:protein-tyrosine phosphatase
MKPLGNGSYCFLLRISTAFFVWVKGNPADSRMRAAAMKRGVKLTSISRPIRRLDFEEFDLILAMDKQNKGIIAFTIP